MTDRVWKINSTYKGAVEDISSLHTVLCQNGYDRGYIEDVSSAVIQRHCGSSSNVVQASINTDINDSKENYPLILPYSTGAFKNQKIAHCYQNYQRPAT